MNTKSSHQVYPAFGFFIPAKYTTHLLSCICVTKDMSRFWGCGHFLPFIILSKVSTMAFENLSSKSFHLTLPEAKSLGYGSGFARNGY